MRTKIISGADYLAIVPDSSIEIEHTVYETVDSVAYDINDFITTLNEKKNLGACFVRFEISGGVEHPKLEAYFYYENTEAVPPDSDY